MNDIFRKLGALFAHGLNMISFTDPQAWEDIFDRHEKEAEFTRNRQSWLPSLPKSPTIFNVDGEDHELFRRRISKALSQPALQSYEPVIQSYADSLVSEITDRAHQTFTATAIVNIASWLSFATYDIMHYLCLGERSRCLETGRHQSWLDLRFKDPQWVLWDAAKRLVPSLAPVWNLGPPRSLKGQVQRTFAELHAAFATTLNGNENAERDNFVAQLTQYPFKNTNTVAKLEATFLAMHIKGSEAMATVLSGVLHYLVGFYWISGSKDSAPPELLAREIRSAFESSSHMDNDRLSELPYLNAVLEEGLRLCHPFPATFTRHAPAGSATICGQHITANTPVSINRFQLCRSPSNFSDPGSFRPERWLDRSEKSGPSAKFPTHNVEAFHPFGFGNSMCLGSDLAYMMMRLILAKLIWHFDLGQTEPMLSWERQKSGVIVERRPWGLGLRLRRKVERDEQHSKVKR